MGGAEIVFLIILGVIIFGPDKLPEVARKAARVVRYLRGIANDAKNTLSDELGPELTNDLHDLNPRGFVQRHLVDEQTTATPSPDIASSAEPPTPVAKPHPLFDPEAT